MMPLTRNHNLQIKVQDILDTIWINVKGSLKIIGALSLGSNPFVRGNLSMCIQIAPDKMKWTKGFK